MHFVFQKELVNYRIFLNFPKHKSKFSYLAQLDSVHLERFQKLTNSPKPLSFLEGGKEGIFSPGIPIGQANFKNDRFFVSLFSDLNQITFVNINLGDVEENK